MSIKMLAVDTASETCSVALSFAGNTYFNVEKTPRKHAELVLPMVDDLLHQAACRLQELDAIAFGCGPGSFTGLRIAAGIVQGLAFGAQLPVIPISSLALVAHQGYRCFGYQHCHVAFDARMGEVYWASYSIPSIGRAILHGQELVCKPSELECATGLPEGVWVGLGAGWKYQELLTLKTGSLDIYDIEIQPSALDLLALAETKLASKNTLYPHQINPVYLRNRVADKPSAPMGR